VQDLQEADPRWVGPYALLRRIGVGGMGRVYLAQGPLGLLAVKVVHPGLARDESFRARFRQEVANGRRVREPWALAVVDADPDAPLPWLATPYVSGPSLDAAVSATGPLPAPIVHTLGAALAESLVHIHETGLVHRDVKPSNVLLGPDRPFLIDLGIARAAEGTQLTATGSVVGTPPFMSPEQAEGRETSAESDVFSLGAVLVFAASGRGPFGDGPPLAIMRRIIDDSPDLRDAVEPVRTVAAACLAKRPADRPTAADVRRMLGNPPATAGGWLPGPIAALAAAAPGQATVVGANTRVGQTAMLSADREPEPARPRIGRRALLLGAAVTGVASVAGVTAAISSSRTPAPAPAPTTPAPAGAPPPQPAQKWTADVGPGAPVTTIVAGNSVYVGARDSLFALDATTGTRRWSFETAPGSNYSPDREQISIGDGAVYVAAMEHVYALDAATGATRWTIPIGGILSVSLHADSGVLYLANGDQLDKRDARTGRPLWTVRTEFAKAPTPVGDRVFVRDMSIVAALAADTGRSVWRYDAGGRFDERLAVADGIVCCFNANDGTLIALDQATGAKRWSATVPRVEWGEPKGRPAIGSGAVYVTGGDEQVHAFAIDSGAPRWNLPDKDRGGGTVSTQPIFAGATVHAGSGNGIVYAWDAVTGAQQWRTSLEGKVESLTVSGGIVYAAMTPWGAPGRIVALAQP
jgi:outer membrane protein assembly factor BamB